MTSEVPTAVESPRGRIVRLPDLLVNQIAAGEVVERPASVVKELVENSLDALASRVEVLLTDGGIAEIAVLDDGIGMIEPDLRLALERHATSKLRTFEDLESIGTYGFRGEALASIAAVAEVELKSRPRDSHVGQRLLVRHGTILEALQPIGMPAGTALRVRGLFSQLPARQKFLRTPATEYAAAARSLRELALGNPGVAFFLHHQGRRVAHYTASTRPGRVRECLKPDWDPLVVLEESDGARVEAYLTPPSMLQDRGELFLFVNGRPVRNRNLLAAVRNAYLQTLGPHHEPSGVVYLDIRPDWVDVNVHPQKLEVRCLRQDTIYSWTVTSVRKAIAMSPSFRDARAEAAGPGEAMRKAPPWKGPAPQPIPLPLPGETSAPGTAPRTRYLGQLKASAYLLGEDDDGLLVLDPHGLDEHRRFRQLSRELENGPLPAQRRLVPRILRIPREREPLLGEHRPLLERLGFDFEIYSDGDVAVKSVPDMLTEEQLEPVFREIVARLEEGPEAASVLLGVLACHGAVRSGTPIPPRQAESLLDGLDGIDEGGVGPHGQPVLLRLSFREIGKHFERS